MTQRSKLIAGLAASLVATAGAAFAQAPTDTAAGTATAPAPGAAVQTTTQTTTMPSDTAPPPPAMPRTGGDPATFVLVGSAISGGMLAIRRRFAR